MEGTWYDFEKHWKIISIWAQFHQHSLYSFYARRSQKHKRHWWLNCIFYPFRIYKRKSCTKNVGEFDTWAQFHQHSMYNFYTRRSQMCKKDSQVNIVILRFCVKVVRRMLMKSTPCVNISTTFTISFCAVDKI